MVGIVNREQETVSYRVTVAIDEGGLNETGPVMLAHEDKWEKEVGFIPERSGENQKVEFSLYKQGQSEAYRVIHLWIDVVE